MESQTQVVMFTDLVGSVKMYSKVSDSVAVDVVRDLDQQVRDALPKHKGTFIKSTGDGHLLVFEDPAASVRCAGEIHDLCDNLARDRRQDLYVRIAMHLGDVYHADGDIHGNTVNLSARILGVTGACETCITGECREKMSPEQQEGFLPHGPEVFKGFTRYTFIYRKPNPNPLTEVTFRPESMIEEDSSHLSTDTLPRHSKYALVLEHPELKKTIEVSEGETHVIGRSQECGTPVPDRMFSGFHAAFAVVEGILWAFDLQSSNGISYRGRRIKRRKPIEKNTMIKLPNGSIQVKLP